MNQDIEAYLDGLLSSVEKQAFEEKLSEDAALRDALLEARRLRNDLDWIAVEKGIAHAEKTFWEKQVAHKRQKWFWGGIAAILVVILCGLWWQNVEKQEQPQPQITPAAPITSDTVQTPGSPLIQPQEKKTINKDRLFAQFFKPYKDESLEPSRRGNDAPGPAQVFQELYWNARYAEALKTFENLEPAEKNNDNLIFLKSNCLLATDQAAAAAVLLNSIIRNDRTRFMAESKWLLALAWLKCGQIEKAKSLLLGIADDPDSPRRSVASQLIGVLQQ